MRKTNMLESSYRKGLHRGLALLLLFSMLFTMLPFALPLNGLVGVAKAAGAGDPVWDAAEEAASKAVAAADKAVIAAGKSVTKAETAKQNAATKAANALKYEEAALKAAEAAEKALPGSDQAKAADAAYKTAKAAREAADLAATNANSAYDLAVQKESNAVAAAGSASDRYNWLLGNPDPAVAQGLATEAQQFKTDAETARDEAAAALTSAQSYRDQAIDQMNIALAQRDIAIALRDEAKDIAKNGTPTPTPDPGTSNGDADESTLIDANEEYIMNKFKGMKFTKADNRSKMVRSTSSPAYMQFTGNNLKLYSTDTNVNPAAVTLANTDTYVGDVDKRLQFFSKEFYIANGRVFVRIYYYNGTDYTAYTVLGEDILNKGKLLDITEIDRYIKNTLWTNATPDALSQGITADIRVHAMQLALSTLGYSVDVDGTYGPGTKEAVRKFQADNRLTANGDANDKTLILLYELATGKSTEAGDSSIVDSAVVQILKQKGFTALSGQPSSMAASSSKHYMTIPSGGITLYTSDTTATPAPATVTPPSPGAVVQLVSNQYYVIDDVAYLRIYNPSDGKAYNIVAGQNDAHLGVMTTDQLASYITGTIWKTAQANLTPLTKGTKYNVEVHAMQMALASLDSLSGSLDGAFGDATEAALKAFQDENNLEVNGKGTKETLFKLYQLALKSENIVSPDGTGTIVVGSDFVATSSGDPASVVEALPKRYIKLTKDLTIFTSAEYKTGNTAPSGSILQLVSTQYYTAGYRDYVRLYYGSTVYNARLSDVYTLLMTEAEVFEHVTNVLYVASPFNSLNEGLGLRGDLRTHALQMALATLGYYSGALDGHFGSSTTAAVKAFQRANRLAVDGRAGPITQTLLYPMVLNRSDIVWPNGGRNGAASNTAVDSTGTLVTNVSVNFRKSTSTSSTRLGVVPMGTTLSYTNVAVVGGTTWYYVVYGGKSGWLMGTYVTAVGTSEAAAQNTEIGYVTITKNSTRVRKTPAGSKTGTVLAIGSIVPLLAQPTTSNGYTWYYIQTSTGVLGYVRGDCATATFDTTGGGTSGTISSTKTYVKLSKQLNIFTTEEQSAGTAAPAGSVLQLVDTTPYTKNGVEYISLYYGSAKYNCVYAEVKADIMPDADLLSYLTGTIWKSSYSGSLRQSFGLTGDAKTHAAQLALTVLGYYSGALDGNFGTGTTTAVRNFQRKNNLTVDGSIGPATWVKLFPMAGNAYSAGSWTSGGGTSGTGTSTSFGTVSSIEKASWSTVSNGALFPSGSVATVLDTQTGKSFRVWRWSGGSHADCVPYTAEDTKIMCEIVGFNYNSNHPSDAKKKQIEADSGKNNPTHTWPDFPSGGVGNKWDRRPALLNVNGRVYCVSIFGWPHGWYSTTGIGKASMNGKAPHLSNNYYGMMCIHFVGSTTHTGTSPDTGHQNSINTAYNYAKTHWPTLVK